MSLSILFSWEEAGTILMNARILQISPK